MTRIDFHFNASDKLGYGCRLLRKIHRAGQKATVYCADSAVLARFDQSLWTFSALDFVPHVMAHDKLAAQTPIVLTTDPGVSPHHDVLVNLSGAQPPHFSRFLRLIEVVGSDAPDREDARGRFRFYRERGYEIHNHDVAGAKN